MMPVEGKGDLLPREEQSGVALEVRAISE